MDTVVVKLEGKEVGRFTGTQFTFGKRVDPSAGLHSTTLVEDPKMMRLVADGRVILVFLVSSNDKVTVEREP